MFAHRWLIVCYVWITLKTRDGYSVKKETAKRQRKCARLKQHSMPENRLKHLQGTRCSSRQNWPTPKQLWHTCAHNGYILHKKLSCRRETARRAMPFWNIVTRIKSPKVTRQLSPHFHFIRVLFMFFLFN